MPYLRARSFRPKGGKRFVPEDVQAGEHADGGHQQRRDDDPGDVLGAVLHLPPSYWSAHPTQLARLKPVIASIDDPSADLSADIKAFREGVRF